MSDPGLRSHKCRSRFFLINIAIGILISAIALFLVISGEYSSLAERKQAEGMLNTITMLGMLYALGAWYGYAFFSPNCKPEPRPSELL